MICLRRVFIPFRINIRFREIDDKQRKIVEVAKAGEPFIDPKAIKRELEHFEYPLYSFNYKIFFSHSIVLWILSPAVNSI
jgi:hypothetical protein